MHLSAAAGTPTLGLFGPSDDRLYRPWAASRLRQGDEKPGDGEASSEAGGPETSEMADLSVASVVRAARDLFERTREANREDALPVARGAGFS